MSVRWAFSFGPVPSALWLAACAERSPEARGPDSLGRAVMNGVVAVTDPWDDGAGLSAPVVADVDGDGWPDLVGGQQGTCVSGCYDPPTATYTDSVVAVWPGGPGGFPVSPTFEAWAPRYDSLVPAAFLGDTDGDGTGEVLFAAPFTSNGAFEEGKVWVAPGAAGALGAPTWTVEGSRQGVHLGQLAEALGDTNGDGFDDLLLGTATAIRTPSLASRTSATGRSWASAAAPAGSPPPRTGPSSTPQSLA